MERLARSEAGSPQCAMATTGAEIRGTHDRLSLLGSNLPFLRVEGGVMYYWFMLWWISTGGYCGLVSFKMNSDPHTRGVS